MIEQIINFLVLLIQTVGYPGVALAMALESFFAPIPSELIMPFAGFVASQGNMNIYLVCLIGGLSGFIGTLPFFYLGHVGNKEFISKLVVKYGKYLFIRQADVDKAYFLFEKRGKIIVFFARLIPIVRSIISIPAGMAKMNFGIFAIYSIAGSLLWSSILGVAGYYLGSNWVLISEIISKYEKFILVIIILCIVIFVVYQIYRFRKEKISSK